MAAPSRLLIRGSLRGIGLSLFIVGTVGGLSGAELASCRYQSKSQTLIVALNGADRFKYVFNKGGAINGIFDLKIAPGKNLIGKSFKGETTDRVLQWTYWNGRYKAPENPVGSKDCRANATMEGTFYNTTCEQLSAPSDGTERTLKFKSRIQHWFYSNLDKHGTPDFETTSVYEVLDDGSLKLTRSVLRRPWILTGVYETQDGGTAVRGELQNQTKMVCENRGHRSMTSYFESWSTFNRNVLPRQLHANGAFDGDGYRFWKPQDLGGWAMACGPDQAVALVFGKTNMGDAKYKLQVSFNKQDLPNHELNVLLPAVETTWPDNTTLTQVLVIVPGAPDDVKLRASALVDGVPVPQIDAQNTEVKLPK